MTAPTANNLNEVRFYQIHRWLNPFYAEQATMTTDLSPVEIDDAIEQRLFSFARSRLPHAGLYGSLTQSGFTIKLQWFQQPELRVDYGALEDLTVLHLRLRRSLRGIFGWGWSRLILPPLVIGDVALLAIDNIIGPPHWINTSNLWQSGDPLLLQPATRIVMIGIFSLQITIAIRSDLRRRYELETYKRNLADILGARKEGRSK